MTGSRSSDGRLRVAIIGSGPAAFYTLSHLRKERGVRAEVDMYDRLPTPFGLVRAGVAPDHQKYKTVTARYHEEAQLPGFCFFGNVGFGEHLTLDDLAAHYHQVVFATGAQRDRALGIPGEHLENSHPATDFVAWYNGHPDFADLRFDLDQERVAVVGVGNVAVDVARILLKSPDELARTDIADAALEALRHSRVREVHLLGRRGPAHAAFTPPEIREMGELATADVHVPADEAALDPVSREDLAGATDRNAARNVDIIQEFAARPPAGKPKRLVIRFLVSPTAIVDDGHGRVGGLKLVRNESVRDGAGQVRARPTHREELLPVGLVFRSVGYRGVRLPDVPFDEASGVIPHRGGRILDQAGEPVPGLYVAGWIKRGPTGVIGTNKLDARETVGAMMEDFAAGRHLHPSRPELVQAVERVRERQPRAVTYQDWQHIDAVEVEKGLARECPRVKFTRIDDMLAVLRR